MAHYYEPDYIVTLTGGANLLLEVKGYEIDQTQAKHQAARRWISAINNWGKLGKWDLLVCREPHDLPKQLTWIVANGQKQTPPSQAAKEPGETLP